MSVGYHTLAIIPDKSGLFQIKSDVPTCHLPDGCENGLGEIIKYGRIKIRIPMVQTKIKNIIINIALALDWINFLVSASSRSNLSWNVA